MKLVCATIQCSHSECRVWQYLHQVVFLHRLANLFRVLPMNWPWHVDGLTLR